MRTGLAGPTLSRDAAARLLRLSALAAVVGLATALRCASLATLGYANHYYTAAVTGMLQSWRNFFFVAAEPGGSVSVDKPPVGLWLQAISARLLGVNGFAVLLPQLAAGVLSVLVVYHLVRRWFGTAAGLLAALALAVTPVAVAIDRNNTMDSTLTLVLLLAAWAFIRATETGRARALLVGAALVGIGFNVKMLQAYLPLPAFCALYFFGSAERLWRKLGKLAVAGVLLVALSLSWAVAVDRVPAERRPYVGSSGDNSVLSLVVGYNGLLRLMGRDGMRGSLAGGAGNAPPLVVTGDGAMTGVGVPGPLRLLKTPLSKEASWFLPLSLVGALLLAARTRLRWPLARAHQALVLWGGWLLAGAAFLSVAGYFHEYYAAILAPPLAALAGIGAVELWRLYRQHPWPGLALLLAAGGSTLWLQAATAHTYLPEAPWLPAVAALFAAGALALVLAALAPQPGPLAQSVAEGPARSPSPEPQPGAKRRGSGGPSPEPQPRAKRRGSGGAAEGPARSQAEGQRSGAAEGQRRTRPPAAAAGLAALTVALLLTPATWSALTALNPSGNQSVPSAYGGQPEPFAGADRLQLDPALLAYLGPRTAGATYLMAVPSAMQGADYVIATGRPVLYLGGFMGEDEVVSPAELERLVAAGELRYVYWDMLADGYGGQGPITKWLALHGSPVAGSNAGTRNAGAPDGTGAGPAGEMSMMLYECTP